MKALVIALLALLMLHIGAAQSGALVTLRAPVVVSAGAPWSVEVQVSSREAGEEVGLTLFNGLSYLEQSVITGTGGVARWDLPTNTVTQSGDSLIIARYAGEETRRRVRVVPGRAAQTDLITTANSILAYGQGGGTLIVLLRDEYGNPSRPSTQAALTLTYPGGENVDYSLSHQSGLAWMPFDSQGDPGRVRVRVSADSALGALELRQTPDVAETVRLELSPRCVASDGRDVLRLSAEALDAHGLPVVDGTLIRFVLGQGFAYGRTSNGRASISLPAPGVLGLHRYMASSGAARSRALWLRVTDESCQ